MPNFKFVISNGEKSYQIEKDQKDCPIMGKKIEETISADFLGLEGYEMVITGGSDKDGFPMRNDVEGTTRKRIVLVGGVGFHPYTEGLRKRKMIRGNTIAADIIQINCKVTKKGIKPLDEILGKKEVAEDEAPKEAPKEEGKETQEKEKIKEEARPEEKKEEPKKEVKEEKKTEVPKTEEKKEVPKEEKPSEEKK